MPDPALTEYQVETLMWAATWRGTSREQHRRFTGVTYLMDSVPDLAELAARGYTHTYFSPNRPLTFLYEGEVRGDWLLTTEPVPLDRIAALNLVPYDAPERARIWQAAYDRIHGATGIYVSFTPDGQRGVILAPSTRAEGTQVGFFDRDGFSNDMQYGATPISEILTEMLTHGYSLADPDRFEDWVQSERFTRGCARTLQAQVAELTP